MIDSKTKVDEHALKYQASLNEQIKRSKYFPKYYKNLF